jgi:hypothetical protein
MGLEAGLEAVRVSVRGALLARLDMGQGFVGLMGNLTHYNQLHAKVIPSRLCNSGIPILVMPF